MAQRVENPPAMQETQVRSVGQEDPLEKEVAMTTSILAWRIPWAEGPGGRATVHGFTKSLTQLRERVRTHTHTHTRIYSNASVFFLVENTSVSLIGRRRILWVNGITVFPPVFVL